jgi:very-short-patch-repair endonuclease
VRVKPGGEKRFATPRNHLPRPADNPPMTPGSTRPRRPRTLSAAEALLWSHLRSQGLEGWLFALRTSHSDSLPTTFVCADARVTVQIDGDPDADASADPGCLRFSSFEVLVATEAVLQAILLALRTALTRRRTN